MGSKTGYENLVDRIQESDDIADSDRDVLDEFRRQLDLLSSRYSLNRKIKLLRHLVLLAERYGDVASLPDDRSHAEETVAWINREFTNEETNRDYRAAIRVFGRHVTDGDEIPESLSWVPSGTSSTYDPAPDPGEMLRWDDEVQDMLDAAMNTRDAAAVALLFDAGLRGGEYASLTVGDIADSEYGLQVTVNGKRGQRSITLIPSVPYVRDWLRNHPAGDDPSAPLWSKLGRNEEVSRTMKNDLLKRVAERAGVTKPVTPTNFRKSSAAHLASKGMNQAHLEDHHGWVRGSSVASRYVSVFAEESDRELARVYGAEVPDQDDDEIAPIECPRCGEQTPRERSLCVWCGQALEPGAAEQAEAVDDLLVEEIAQSGPERAEQLMDLRKEVREDPEARADLIDRWLDLS
ncbi:tyrosine-type recombinase/integrase [Halolamina rubra]|uniref:tyrosine-type recombinase/integrase n=1 Tax=Halolamina rubra TaxID=1380430 RepID=UPI0006788001|nr:tyrosine-type recombinase/integrase [Halolamina rubra]